MSCLGVHCALSSEDVIRLREITDEQDRLHFLQEEIEENYFATTPEFAGECDKAWDAIHRTLADGTLNWDGGDYPLNHVILAGEQLYTDTDYIMSLKSSDQVRDIVLALRQVSEDDFRARYFRIEESKYGFPLTETDLEYTWHWFIQVRSLFETALKEGRWVLFTADQ